ncbi:SLAM family member 9-like [Discoglossus pictus]
MQEKLQVFLIIWSGALLDLGSQQAVQLQVNGLINQSVNLSNNLILSHPIKRVIWQFLHNGNSIEVVEFQNEQLEITEGQFTNRVEVYNNGTALRIMGLRMEDSGIFTALITFINKTTIQLSFKLNVYEPVPIPHIMVGLDKNNTDWCNFTLICYVQANQSMLSFSWMHRQNDQEYQPYGSGRTIQVSLTPELPTIEFLCLVHNPSDQKNASLKSLEICHAFGRRPSLVMHGDKRLVIGVICSMLLITLIVLGVIIWKTLKRHKESTTVKETNQDVDYQTGTFDLKEENTQNPENGADDSPKGKLHIVYASLIHPT